MGTEVLRPQDCLVDKLRFSPPAFNRRKSFVVNGHGLGSPKPNTYPNRKPANVNRPDRKRSPTKEFQPPPQQRKPSGVLPLLTNPRRSPSDGVLLQTHVSKPVTNHPNPEVESGRVRILRRGQSLDSLDSGLRKGDSNNKSPKLAQFKAVSNTMVAGGADVYAGSAIFVSPSPSSLPLPSFFSNKKSESDVSATRDLRRLLGLE